MCDVQQRAVKDEEGDEVQYLANICDKALCVEDFCGYTTPGHLPVQYWADWCPVTSMVYFGGDWCDVPPLPCAAMPTDEIINAHVDTAHAANDCQAIKNL